jgi:hypothetical protein
MSITSDSAFDACRKMLNLYLQQASIHSHELFMFAENMQRFPSHPGNSLDPALLEVFEQVWRERAPEDEEEAFCVCIDFIGRELISRPLHDADFVQNYELARTEREGSLLHSLWLESISHSN